MKYGVQSTKPYKYFHPRQAARAGIVVATPTNFGTCGIFNNSPGDRVLIVREYRINCTSGTPYGFGQNHGRLTGTAGTVGPLVTGEPAVIGQIDYSDQAAKLTVDYLINQGANLNDPWQHDFPIAVIQPGWSFFVQLQTKAVAIGFACIWEAVFPHQLDY